MSQEFYPFKDIEKKWQKKWDEAGLFKMDPDSSKEKYYCLMMFPYPSAALHVGHGRNYIIGDSVTRYKIMRGYNVLSPMGFDAFGLPAENAAIKNGIHPEISTLNNIKTMKRQFDSWGAGYDWEREVVSCLPAYYKWTQWIFLQLYKRGLAYKKKASVNWCPSCQTVLANEQVIDGECERCSSQVNLRDLEQWFFKITEYSQRLLDDLELLKDWPERVKLMQKNWIGRSEGVEINFKVKDSNVVLTCFTTRVDTIYGVTYMVISNEHPTIQELIKDTQNKKEIEKFIDETRKENAADRVGADIEKRGVFTGKFVINPMTGKAAPLWIGNYVVTEYGTGAVMAVPAHDHRDFEFAKKYGLSIEVVIDNPKEHLDSSKMKEAYVEEGVMVNSGKFNGLPSLDAIEKITDFMEENKIGKREVHYKLRDWLISRQRYWGAPIPMIYCDKCGMQPVEEKDLPVLLPKNIKFKPHGVSPLKDVPEFVNTKCPKCSGNAMREIDTLDTFVDSSWYFLRYLSPKDDKKPFDKELVNKWLPLDQYIGGVEHAILHLLYSRFIVKVLYDMGHVGFKEPFAKLFTQGMITKNGIKMSKSRGNVVSSDDLIEKYGADTVRLYTLFISPPEKDAEWSDRGVEGAWRFLNKVWRLVEERSGSSGQRAERDVDAHSSLRQKTHATIKKVTEDMEGTFHFNTAISSIMELVNEIYTVTPIADRDNYSDRRSEEVSEAIQAVVILLAPFVPHIAEEMWEKLGNKDSVFRAEWPVYDKAALKQNTIELPIQINGKLRSKIEISFSAGEDEIRKQVLADAVVNKWIEGKPLKKIIIVKGKLVNIVLSLVFILFFCAGNILADTVCLKNGNKIKGIITKETEGSVEIKINPGAKVTFSMDDIKNIERDSKEQHAKLEEGWATCRNKSEVNEITKEIFEEEQMKKGLVKYKNEWIMPDEKERLQAASLARNADKDSRERKFSLKDDNIIRSNIAEKLLTKGNWFLRESENFYIFYRDFIQAKIVGDKAEYYFEKIIYDLGYEKDLKWDKKCQVFIVDSVEKWKDFLKGIGFNTELIGGFVPNYGQKEMFLCAMSEAYLAFTFPHELTHLIFKDVAGKSNIPLWLNEGLANYEANLTSVSNELLAKSIKQGTHILLGDLLRMTNYPQGKDTKELFYAQSEKMVEFLITQYGREKFRKFCNMMLNDKSFKGSISSVYGKDFKDIEDFNIKLVEYIVK